VNLMQPLRLTISWFEAWVFARVFHVIPEPAFVPVRRSLRTLAAALAVTVAAPSLMACVTPAFAAEAYSGPGRGSAWQWQADGRLVDVDVLVDGQQAPLYFKPGDFGRSRHYFQALQGRNYALRLTNNTGRRVGVLIAVDGLNVVNGERSSLSRHEPLYVLDPHESATIRGWRTSLDQVRRFVFVDEQRSYAERTGQANGDMGWIRVVSFEEVGRRAVNVRPEVREGKERGWEGDRYDEPRAESAPAPQSAKPQSEQRSMAGRENESAPGTGWGDRRHDPVQQTWFEPARRSSDHLVFRYEYESGLRALGISPRRFRVYERDRGDLGFARPPRW
jgi:hypothetical protein